MISISGGTVSAVEQLVNLARLHNDISKWERADLLVTFDWFQIALETGYLLGKPEAFEWPRLERLPAIEMRGMAAPVIACEEKRKNGIA
jgi:hypothetical protein